MKNLREFEKKIRDPLSLLSGWTPFPDDTKTKVVFGVFTSPKPKYVEQLNAVAETWAKDVSSQNQKLLVVGVNGSAPGVTYKLAPMCEDGHINNPGISCKEATLLSTGYKLGADWVVVAGSDNYVLPKNWEELLAKEDKNKPQILAIFGCGGGKYCEDGKSGICGGGGYAISKSALDKMIGKGKGSGQKFIKESMKTAMTVGGGWSDQVTSCIARRHGVAEVQLAGLYGWKLCADSAMECNFDKATYRAKITSTNPKALTFHYIGPSEMRTIHKLYKDSLAGVSVLVQDQQAAEEALLCTDGHTACYYWANAGECVKNPGYMKVTCARSCNTCGSKAAYLQTKSSLNFLQVSKEDEYTTQRKAYIRMVNKELHAATGSYVVM